MQTRKRKLFLFLSAVIALVCLWGFFAVPRFLGRQNEVIFRYKTGRHTAATVVRKEHTPDAPPGHEWAVYYRVNGFPIHNFHNNVRTGEWEQADVDQKTTEKVEAAEKRRNEQSGDRVAHLSQEEYESLSVGDCLDVSLRLRTDDESVEILNEKLVKQ